MSLGSQLLLIAALVGGGADRSAADQLFFRVGALPVWRRT
jgi:hypothetical protein